MPNRAPPPLLNGLDKRNNFIVGTLAGVIACEVVGVLLVIGGLPWQTLLYCLIGAPFMGLLVLAAGTDPHIRVLAEEDNARLERGERPLPVDKVIDTVQSQHPRLSRTANVAGRANVLMRLLRR